MNPDIAVVIVNWNKCADVTALLCQLSDISKPKFDVFVVDNASTDNSVEAIKHRFQNVRLIINNENLGGTGGFNSGIDYICKKNNYSYIWLLDNDARIEEDTLSELYDAMKSDSQIGLAGSRIVDIENRKVTVETGADFRWDIIGVLPVQQNTKKIIFNADIVNVDYVAICSALVRINAIREVGLMDERLFLFWDDMDWGLSFNEKGFKVVAVQSSVAYHGSFSERDRGAITNYYYGIRNPFLVYTKHTNFLRRSFIFYRSLKRYYRRCYFLKMTGSLKKTERLIRKAINDYMQNKWGKFSHNLVYNEPKYAAEFSYENTSKNRNDNIREILVFLVGSSLTENELMLESIKKQYPTAKITVMVNSSRANYYDNYMILQFDDKKAHNLWYNFRKFMDIRRKKFDLIATIKHSPFAAAVKQAEFFNKEGKSVGRKITGSRFLFLLGAVVIFSEIETLLMLPAIMYKSLQYSRSKMNEKTRK